MHENTPDTIAAMVARLETTLGGQIAELSAKVDRLSATVIVDHGSSPAAQPNGSPATQPSGSAVTPMLVSSAPRVTERERAVRAKRRETLMAKFAKEEVFGVQGEVAASSKTKTGFYYYLRKHAIILPTSAFRQGWDFVAILLGLYIAVFLPYRIAFVEEHVVAIAAFDVALDCFFLLDLLLNFFTAYVDDVGSLVTKRRLIARHYATSWLFPDLLSSIPWDWFFLGVSIESDPTLAAVDDAASEEASSELGRFRQLLRVLKCIKLLRLLRITRVGRYLGRYLHKLAEWFGVELLLNSNVLRLIGVCFFMALFAHWNGCAQYLFAKLEADEIIANGTRSYAFREDSWVARLQDDGVISADNEWTISFFTAVCQILALSVGMREPRRAIEMWGYLASIVLGAFIYALFIASLTTVIAESDHSAKEYRSKLNMVNEYIRHVRLPKKLQAQLRSYYELWFPSKRSFDEDHILGELSKPLRERMALHKCRTVLQALQLVTAGNELDPSSQFKKDVGSLPEAISLNLERVVYVAGDFVIREGEEPEGMFFVSDGNAEVVRQPDDTVITTLGKGSFFGEMALLEPNGHATASVRVRDHLDGYCLSRAAFEKLVHDYPSFREYLQSVAKLRMQATSAGGYKQLAADKSRRHRVPRQLSTKLTNARQKTSKSLHGLSGHVSGAIAMAHAQWSAGSRRTSSGAGLSHTQQPSPVRV